MREVPDLAGLGKAAFSHNYCKRVGCSCVAGRVNWFTGTLSVGAQSKPVWSFLSRHIEKKANTRTSTRPAAPRVALSVAVCHTPPGCLSVL